MSVKKKGLAQSRQGAKEERDKLRQIPALRLCGFARDPLVSDIENLASNPVETAPMLHTQIIGGNRRSFVYSNWAGAKE
jgi:hypothetical protein